MARSEAQEHPHHCPILSREWSNEAGYGTTTDQAEVSPDSKESVKINPVMLKTNFRSSGSVEIAALLIIEVSSDFVVIAQQHLTVNHLN